MILNKIFNVNEKLRYPLRALIAVSIGLLFYRFFNDRFSTWILWTVVVLLQSTTGATLRKATARVMGTLVGVLIGMLLLAAFPKNPNVYYGVILISLFLMLYNSKIHYFISMLFGGLGIIFTLVLFLSHGTLTDAWSFAISRAFDTLIGAVIVIITSYLFWPSKTKRSIDESLCKVLENASQYMLLLKEQCIKKEVDLAQSTRILRDYSEAMSKLRLQLLEASYEPNSFLSKIHIMNAIVTSLTRIEKNMFSFFVNLSPCLAVNMPDYFGEELIKYLQSLNDIFMKLERYIETGRYNLEGDGITSINQILLAGMANKIAAFEENKQFVSISKENDIRFNILLANLRSFCVQLEYIFSALRQARG